MVKQIMNEWHDELAVMPYYNRPTTGDASETALIKFFQPIEDVKHYRDKHDVGKNVDNTDAEIKFNSKHKFSVKIRKA